MENILFEEDINHILNIARDEDINVRIDKHNARHNVDVSLYGLESDSIEWIHFSRIENKKQECINTISRIEQITPIFMRSAAEGLATNHSDDW